MRSEKSWISRVSNSVLAIALGVGFRLDRALRHRGQGPREAAQRLGRGLRRGAHGGRLHGLPRLAEPPAVLINMEKLPGFRGNQH